MIEEAASPNADIRRLVGDLHRTFATGKTRELGWRLDQLSGIVRFLEEEQNAIAAALALDLGKPAIEAFLTDIVSVRREVAALVRGLPRWTKRARIPLPWMLLPGAASVVRAPRGVALIISPWNYPVNLVLVPLAAALSAGNCAIVKPSELAPASAALLAGRLGRYLDRDAIAVVEGGGDVAEAIIDAKVDHVFFTGSSRIGRLVMEAASRHLTPVTLELGGKSPAIVCADADLEVAARRVVWGKFLNVGQTCVAPDFVLVDSAIEERFVERCREAVLEFYGADPERSPDYGRIVNDAHFKRLTEMLDSAFRSGATIVCGGERDRADRYLSPTIVTGAPSESSLRREEIFGPVLPIVSYRKIEEAIEIARELPTPLALYLFTADDDTYEQLSESIPAASICVNATLQQFGAPALPFGGLGESGFGNYHGRWGFETFSHVRAVLRRPARPDWRLAYPPYRAFARALFRRIL